MSDGRVKQTVGLALARLVALLIVVRGAEAFAEGIGPFPVRNFQPIQLLFLGMQGDRATVITKRALEVRVEMASTSTVFREETGRVSTTMKFETLRSGLFFRYGLTDRLEVGLEVPALYRYRGVLEGVITATERVTTGEAPARTALKGTSFAYNLSRDGRTLFSGGDADLGLGDITLSSKYQILSDRESTPAVALRMAVKVPSGDDRRFFGSGHADVGMGLAVEKAVAAHWIVYGNLNGILPTGRVAGLMLRPTVSAIAAVEYLWSPAVSLVAQFDYFTSPFKNVGTPVLDEGVTELAAGFNYRLRNNLLWQVYGVENLDFIRGSAADITLSTLVTYRFGP